MAVRNGERYLREALHSVLAQTYARTEIILVDDGSIDATADIMHEAAKSDARVLVLRQRPAGLAASLNEGVRIASGEWIARMDGDDISRPSRLERQLTYAQSNALDVCGSDVRTFGHTLPRHRRYQRSHEATLLKLLFNSAFCHPATLIRAELLRKTPYDETLAAAQDYNLWVRLALGGARMGNVPETLLDYRVHGKQVTRTYNAGQVKNVLAAAHVYWRWYLSRSGIPVSADMEDLLPLLIDKTQTPSERDIVRLLVLFEELAARSADPEGILQTNLFNLLVRSDGPYSDFRHVELATNIRFSILQRLMLLGSGLMGRDMRKFAAQIVRRYL
jgi:glycosyltransferase involved in cell wall biosynthesis